MKYRRYATASLRWAASHAPAAVAVVLAMTLAACSRGESAEPASGQAREPEYVMAGKVPYENLVWSGEYALLTRDGVLVDSVDAAFGVHRVGRDSVLFLPVRSDSSPEGPVRSITEHVLFDGTTRTRLGDIVPHFNSGFSSPAIIDGALLYWGLHQVNGIDSVKAVRYEFGRKRLNIQPLTDSITGSDNRFYFTPPHLEGKEIVFKSPEGRWAFRVPRASQ